MNAERRTVYQLNLSPSLGGAEVYTGFFSRALTEIGWPTELIVAPGAKYWGSLDMGESQVVPLVSADALLDTLAKDAILVIHSPAPESLVQRLSQKVRVLALAHQALYNDKQPNYYRYAEIVIPVSHYVIETLKRRNYTNIYPFPLYGIGGIKPVGHGVIQVGDRVDWDQRKLRDQALSLADRLTRPLRGQAAYQKRVGITLGIVSRLAEAKQFPELFARIAAHVETRSSLWIEVFGRAVGYRALREFRRAVAPIKDRVRYWGHQDDVAAAYQGIDYLLTGLPERESFGLNIIEAQMCGTPVLAPRVAPFTETIVEGLSGFLYTDPRQDSGQDFGRVLDLILKPGSRPDPLQNTSHLAQFTFPVFCDRVDKLMDALTQGRIKTHVNPD